MFDNSNMKSKTRSEADPLVKLVGVCAWAGLALMSVWGTTANAVDPDDASTWYAKGDIPVTVTLTDVSPVGAAAEETLYVSIQTRETYRSMRGHGGILRILTPGTMEAIFHVAEPGEYAVSVWHDRDNDMRFSMDEKTYQILDGWGASGNPPTDRMPAFDDVKVEIPNIGTSVTIEMINPS